MKAVNFSQISRVFILCVVLFFSAQTFAQDVFELKGNVVNLTKERVKDAKVSLVNPVTLEQVAVTQCDRNGKFSFQDVEKGEYLVTVTKEGYKRNGSYILTIDSNGKCTKKVYATNSNAPKEQQLAVSK